MFEKQFICLTINETTMICVCENEAVPAIIVDLVYETCCTDTKIARSSTHRSHVVRKAVDLNTPSFCAQPFPGQPG